MLKKPPTLVRDKSLGLESIAIVMFVSLHLIVPVQAGAPEIPTPPKSTLQWVGEDLHVNSNPLAARRFESEVSMERVLQFYRHKWQREQAKNVPGYVESNLLPWRLITRFEEPYLLQVMVQPRNRHSSWGYLSLSKLSKSNKAPVLAKRFPKMRGSAVLNEVRSNDPGKKGRTLVIANRYSVASNANFYRNHFTEAGWQPRMDQAMQGRGHVLSFARSNGLINIVIGVNDEEKITTIVVNDVNSGL